jgi:hypothetical protein
MKEKLKLIFIGYIFTFLNIYLTSVGKPLVGIGFGLVSVYFFINALLIKPKKDE